MSNLNVNLVSVLVYVTSDSAVSALFCHFQWLRQTSFPVPFVLHISATMAHTAFLLPWGSWLLQSFFPPFPNPTGLSLVDFDLGHLKGLEDPSFHQGLTHNLRAQQELFWGTSDSWCLGMEKTLSLTYVLTPQYFYYTVLEIQEIHSSFCYQSFAWNSKDKKWEQRQPEGNQRVCWEKKPSSRINLDI